jgi:hypothetical protein
VVIFTSWLWTKEPQQALDTAVGDCIMLQRTNLEPHLLQSHDGGKKFKQESPNGQNIH